MHSDAIVLTRSSFTLKSRERMADPSFEKNSSLERTYTERLLRFHHLNVEERKALIDCSVRESVCRIIISESLAAVGVFPGESRYQTGIAAGDYLQLERTSKGIALHSSAEFSLGRYSQMTDRYEAEERAIEEYLIRLFRDGRLDGISIRWKC